MSWRNIALIIGLFLGINSCCTKKYCEGADKIYEINFYNFAQAELDTITIISYFKNSNFTTAIDSSITYASESGQYFSAYTNNRLNTELDYKIKLLSTGQVITLTDFQLKKKGCNSCFPYRPESDLFIALDSYHVNGQKQFGSRIKIYR